jgi:cyclohexyl-isocyanide hydratase
MNVACVLFPKLTQLDLTGPYEVFHRVPGARVHLVASTLEPVASEAGLAIVPTATFATAPPCDVVFVPGGPGVNDAMLDHELLDFLRRQGESARWIASACTGALVLGAAGFLQGRRATTHWASMEFLAPLGATPVAERFVMDGKLATGGGVTAGIDIALALVGAMSGREVAEAIQLVIEYDPDPPFETGRPERAPEPVLRAVLDRLAPIKQRRREVVEQAAAKLATDAARGG